MSQNCAVLLIAVCQKRAITAYKRDSTKIGVIDYRYQGAPRVVFHCP